MRFWVAALAAVVASTVLSGCMGDPLPWPTVRDFLLAWQQQNYRQAAQKTTGQPEQVADALRSAEEELGARDLRMRVEHLSAQGDSAEATFIVRMWLDGIGRRWSYQAHMELRRKDGDWKIQWSPSVIHPKLGENEELAVLTDPPSRAPVFGSDGRPLVRATPVVTLGVEPGALVRRDHVLHVLADVTGADWREMRKLVRAAQPDSFVPVATLRRSEYVQNLEDIDQLQGVRTHRGTMPLPPTPSFAHALLGGVGAVSAAGSPEVYTTRDGDGRLRLSGLQLAFRQRLAGTAGSRVVTLKANGAQAEVLATFHGQQSKAVHATIDGDVQKAAETALSSVQEPAAFVAVQASTGKILAAANRPKDSLYNRAFSGKYPPGSAFKIVATEALLSDGMKVSSPVPCPPKRIVDGTTFRGDNYVARASGTASLRNVFVDYCKTAFVGVSRKFAEGQLREAAATMGIGADWELRLPAFTGSMPRFADPAERAKATIGQGKVRVSPLTMALAAAAIDTGTWHLFSFLHQKL